MGVVRNPDRLGTTRSLLAELMGVTEVQARQCRCGRGPVGPRDGWLVCIDCAIDSMVELEAREPYDPEMGLSRFDPVEGDAAGAVADLRRDDIRSSWQKCPAGPGRRERLRRWASWWLNRLGALWRRLDLKPRRRIQRPPPPKPDYRPPAQRPPPAGAGSAIRSPPRTTQWEPRGWGLSPGWLPDNPAVERIPTDAELARDDELPVAGIVTEQ